MYFPKDMPTGAAVWSVTGFCLVQIRYLLCLQLLRSDLEMSGKKEISLNNLAFLILTCKAFLLLDFPSLGADAFTSQPDSYY